MTRERAQSQADGLAFWQQMDALVETLDALDRSITFWRDIWLSRHNNGAQFDKSRH